MLFVPREVSIFQRKGAKGARFRAKGIIRNNAGYYSYNIWHTDKVIAVLSIQKILKK